MLLSKNPNKSVVIPEETKVNETNEKPIMKAIKIKLDGQNKAKKKLNINCSLSDARIQLIQIINTAFLFLDKENFIIDKELEIDEIISNILVDDVISLKSSNNNAIKDEINLNFIKPKNVPLPDATLIKEEGKLKIYQYPQIELTKKEEATANIILIVGQTGSGKTTFINAFVNYLMDIELEDDFRYNLIYENERLKSESQTKGLHIYNIRSKSMILKIVDTQGFGDTNGIEEDEKITMIIKDSFIKELNSINAILFVVKASDTRLTPHQKYIFSSIISLFGKDVRKNFISLITFYNGTEKPSAVTTLEQSDFKTIISFIENPWYLCFDSKIIYSDPEDELNYISYKKAKTNYKCLCDKIISLHRNSLTQSKENLILREKIEMQSKALLELLKMQMDKLAEIDDQKKYIEENKKKINDNTIQYIPKKRIEYEPEPIKNGKKATVCRVCKWNCHYPCKDTTLIGYDVLKYGCKIWTWDFNCTFCPNKCPQSCHELSDKKYEKKEYIEYIKVDEAIDYNLNPGINKSLKFLQKLQEEEKELKIKINLTQCELKKKYDELKKIAINCTSYQTTIEFLEELIKEEQIQKEKGYLKRIELYRKMIVENENILKVIQV
jgi:predicted GTPase